MGGMDDQLERELREAGRLAPSPLSIGLAMERAREEAEAARNRYPVHGRVCANCGLRAPDPRSEPICNVNGLVGPHRWVPAEHSPEDGA